MKNAFTNTLILLAGCVLVAGCGRNGLSSNPDPAYDNLRKQSVPTARGSGLRPVAQPPGPTLLSVALIAAEPAGAVFSFTEGVAATVSGTGRLLVLNVDFDVVASGLPTGAQFDAQVTNGIAHWSVQWAPPVGYVATQDQARKGSFIIIIKPKGSIDSGAQQQLKVAGPDALKQTFDFTVRKTGDAPYILQVNGLSSAVNEGSAQAFSIDVQDIGSLGGTAPTVTIKADTHSTNEVVKMDGTPFIQKDPAHVAPELLAPGQWRFYYIFNTKDKAFPRPTRLGANKSTDQATVSFAVAIVSVSKLTDLDPRQFQIKYDTAAQSPKITLGQNADLTFKMGATNTLDLEVESPVADGVLKVATLDASKALQAVFGSKAKLSCSKQSGLKMACRMSVPVSCDAAALENTTQTLEVRATNNVGVISEVGSWKEQVKIVKPDGVCTKPVKPASTGARK